MRKASLEETLIEAARRLPEADHVPLGFEKRVMARLAAPVDAAAYWARGLWKAALPSVVLTCILISWSLALDARTAQAEDPLAADLELVMIQQIESLASEFLE